MNQISLDDYLNRFKKHINSNVDILIGVDKNTGKNIFVPYTVIRLGTLSSTKENNGLPNFDQRVVLKDNATGTEITKSIQSVIDYFEKPEISNKPKKRYLTP